MKHGIQTDILQHTNINKHIVVHIKHNLTFWWMTCTLLSQSNTVKTYMFEYKIRICAVDHFVMQQISETCAMPKIYPLWWTFVIMKDLNWHQFLSGILEKEIQFEINDFQNVRKNQLIIYQNVLLLMFWRNSIWQAK
jgi:hypothetical protein